MDLKAAKTYTLRRLAAKNYASFELRLLLKKKEVSGKDIEMIIQEYQSQGYINDNEWAASFIRIQQMQKKGPIAIVHKLKQKGTPESLIEAHQESINNKICQQESIQKLLLTSSRSRDLTNYNERQKVIASLIRKGFPFDQINEAMSSF